MGSYTHKDSAVDLADLPQCLQNTGAPPNLIHQPILSLCSAYVMYICMYIRAIAVEYGRVRSLLRGSSQLLSIQPIHSLLH